MRPQPKEPDWEGLDALVSTTVTARGSMELPKFNGRVSSAQRGRAVVLKQGHLLREERSMDAKRKSGPASNDTQAQGLLAPHHRVGRATDSPVSRQLRWRTRPSVLWRRSSALWDLVCLSRDGTLDRSRGPLPVAARRGLPLF